MYVPEPHTDQLVIILLGIVNMIQDYIWIILQITYLLRLRATEQSSALRFLLLVFTIRVT
jgi:hypothetical protein